MAENITGEISATACSLEYKWVIHYDCLFGKKVGDVLKSPVFTTINIGNSCQWQLELYPNGLIEVDKNFFSIYLYLLSGGEVKVKVLIKVIDNKGELVKREVIKEELFECHTALNNMGIPKFVNRNFIEENNSCGGDKLTITCEIMVLQSEEQKDILRTDVYCKHRQLIDDFEQLMNDEEFSDIVFTIGDKEVHAHKNVISKRSPVLAATFRSEMREEDENKVEIADVKYEVFLEMLRYIYAEKVNGIENIACDLIVAAEKYSLDGLKLLCDQSLTSNMTADNALEYLLLAERYNVEGLKAKAIEYIVTKAINIVKKPEFRQLPSNIICDVCLALADKKK